jgi:hypothetical protein
MPRFTRTSVALACALAMSATACGSDKSAVTEADVAIAAIASQMASKMPADQALCTAKALVKTLPPAKMHDVGLLNKDNVAQLTKSFDRATATAIADAAVPCWDWRTSTEALAASYPAATTTGWNAYVSCAEKLDDLLRSSVIEANTKNGKAAPQAEFAAAEQQCRKSLGKPATTN